MNIFIFLLMILLACARVNIAFPLGNYTNLRNEILEYEERLMIGANLTLNDVENTVNGILMKWKWEELDAGFKNPRMFNPSRNFLEAKEDIEKSKVFELLRRMPKGAVLHAHDSAIVNSEYVFHNITYRDDLYVCVKNDTVKLHFFREPDETCQWELLKKVREDPSRGDKIDKMIKQRLSMKCDDPSSTYTNVDKAWTKFLDIFAFVGPIVRYRPVYEDHFLEALKELHRDNVMYLEIRSTLPILYDFDGTDYKPEDVVALYEKATKRFKEEHPDFLGVKVIYAPRRSCTREQVWGYIKRMKELKKMHPEFVAGFDLVGQEDKGQTLEYFADMLRNEQEEHDIKYFFHAGETNWLGASTDENLVDAILLNTRRIGHGYALSSHPFLLELTRRMDIAIEVNPISNQVLKLVDDMRNHAARVLFSGGYPLVISNDDPGFWGASGLSYDFYAAFMGLMSKHADLRSLKQLAMNSLSYSSMNREEQKHALNTWEKKWRAFVEDVAKE